MAEVSEPRRKSVRERALEEVAATWEKHARNTKTALRRAYEAVQHPPRRIRNGFGQAEAMADHIISEVAAVRQRVEAARDRIVFIPEGRTLTAAEVNEILSAIDEELKAASEGMTP